MFSHKLPSLLLLAYSVTSLIGLAHAQPIISILPGGPNAPGATRGYNNDYYFFRVDPNGTVFDRIEVDLRVSLGVFRGTYDVRRFEWNVPGFSDETDVLGRNTAGVGWLVLGLTDSRTQFRAIGGPLGGSIQNPVDFVQIVAWPGSNGTWTFNFSNDDVLIDSQSGLWGIPEPTTCTLILAALCVIVRRSR